MLATVTWFSVLPRPASPPAERIFPPIAAPLMHLEP